MTQEKDIEKIAKLFEDYSLEYDDSGQGIVENYYYFRELAKRVYHAGYRKPLDSPELREKIVQETRTLLFGYNVGTDYIEPTSTKFADQIIALILPRGKPHQEGTGG